MDSDFKMFAPGEFLNSAGESDSTSSPLSTDGCSEAESRVYRHRSKARSGQSAVPVQANHAKATRPGVPAVQLQPLGELGVVGACKRGRRKGRRNRTPIEREEQKDNRRTCKNARERVRVQNVNQEYENLRLALGTPLSDRGKVKKVATLNHAIDYIKALMSELEERQAGEAPDDQPGPSGSDSSSASATNAEVVEPEPDPLPAELEVPSFVAETAGDSDSTSLICDEELSDEFTFLPHYSSSPAFTGCSDCTAQYAHTLHPNLALFPEPEIPWTMPPPLSHYDPPTSALY